MAAKRSPRTRKARPTRLRPPQHKHVVVRYGSMQAPVDEGMADIIYETWRAGLRTLECCQGRFDRDLRQKRAYICLPSPDAERWLEVVAPHVELPSEEGPLSQEQERQIDRRLRRIGFQRRGALWRHDLFPYHDDFGGEVHVRFSVLIDFPATELVDVLELLRKYNAATPANRRAFEAAIARAENAMNYACGATRTKPYDTDTLPTHNAGGPNRRRRAD